MIQAEYEGIRFTDADVVNPGEFIPGDDKYNPHKVRPWLIHDHGFALAVVFASCEQDALDEAVDNDKLDRFMLDPKDQYNQADYMKVVPQGEGFEVERDGAKVWLDWDDSVTFLGNASEPFDIESLGMVELPTPPFSFCALFNARPVPKVELPDHGPPGTATKSDPLGDIFYEVPGGEG